MNYENVPHGWAKQELIAGLQKKKIKTGTKGLL